MNRKSHSPLRGQRRFLTGFPFTQAVAWHLFGIGL
jgi:hypothetical protein